jgi:1,4-alpha-glucan branching enzyme
MKKIIRRLFRKKNSFQSPPAGYLNPFTTLGELDLHLISEGRHEKLWKALGARVIRDQSGELLGTAFAVWAPNARNVSLIGDHNFWDKRTHPMIPMGANGLWEIFIPELGAGAKYKYCLHLSDGRWVDHADPLARMTEIPPLTASIVEESGYQWRDREWIARREQFKPWARPVSIYEIHLGSWRQGLSYLQLADELGDYLTENGFTHVEFLPLMEHPYTPSWGYQVTSYFAPTSRFGTPDELRYLIDHLHHRGIGVILDWVPAHFPKDEWALARFDGTALYEHEDPRLGEHPDWGTLIFNFGRKEVRNFLVASALYWFEEFHIDGLRVDAVASMIYLDYSRNEGEWLPNSDGGRENWEAVKVLQETCATAYRNFPGIMMIAEESTAWSGVTRATSDGGLGFGFKWNMGWMHDSLKYLQREPVHRAHHHNEMTFSILYAWSENFLLPISHDEVVHGKKAMVNKFPGDRWQKLATLRAFYGYMWSHPGKKLIFMGSEFAQNEEWQESTSLPWHLTQYKEHLGVQRFIKDLNQIYRSSPALWERDSITDGFQWLIHDDAENNVIAFIRWPNTGSPIISLSNFSAKKLEKYRIPLPLASSWREVINSDAEIYGGSGVSNHEIVVNREENFDYPASTYLTLAPLSTSWLIANSA